MPVIVERPKSAMQARRCLSISMFAYINEEDVSVEKFVPRKICTPFRSPWTMRRS